MYVLLLQNSKVVCQKKACPVLSCPDYQTKIPDGECCPKCMGKRKYDEFLACIIPNYKKGNSIWEEYNKFSKKSQEGKNY